MKQELVMWCLFPFATPDLSALLCVPRNWSACTALFGFFCWLASFIQWEAPVGDHKVGGMRGWYIFLTPCCNFGSDYAAPTTDLLESLPARSSSPWILITVTSACPVTQVVFTTASPRVSHHSLLIPPTLSMQL